MSVVACILIVTKERNKMFTKEDVAVASVSWDDRYYTSPECAECGEEISARTMADLAAQMDEHACAFVIE
jgi:formylmethanofuran dehydrogenase subunit E